MIIAPQFTLIGQEFLHGDLMTTPRKEEMKRKQEQEIIHYRDQSQKKSRADTTYLKVDDENRKNISSSIEKNEKNLTHNAWRHSH